MKWWNRLSLRLTLFVLFLAIIPLAFFGLTTIQDIQEVRLRSVAESHRNLVKEVASQIETSFQDTIKEIHLLIEATELESAVRSDKEWFLQLLIKNLPHIYTLTLANNDGQETIKVGRDTVYNQDDLERHFDHLKFEASGESKPIFGAFHSIRGNILLFDLYIPILSPMERRVTEVLVAEIDVQKLLEFTADMRLGKTGYIYVVNSDGKFLAHPDHSAVLAGEDALDNPLVKDFVAGRKSYDSNVNYFNRKQVEVVTNGRVVEELKLMVVVAQSVDEALGAVMRISRRQTVSLIIVLFIVLLFSIYVMTKTIQPLRRLADGAKKIGEGDLSHRIAVTSSDELGSVTQSFNRMAMQLQKGKEIVEEQDWLKQGAIELEARLRGDQTIEEICQNVVTYMATFLKQQVGVIYYNTGHDDFKYLGGYAFKPGRQFLENFHLGEGIPGEAAREKKIVELNDIPEEYISINSGLGTMVPRQLTIVPFILNDQVEAVIELGAITGLSELQKRFFAESAETVAMKIASGRARQDLSDALVRTRQQAEELNRQQEELQAANEEMEEQTQLLRISETKLKEQREELQAANEELEEKTDYLERNKRNIEEKNRVLEELQKDLEKKAEDLSLASRYKSEFLANMSHELRTPLNSLLLLAKLLTDNRDGNLNEDQVESAQIIYNSGDELLNLINEILDLSKIEAGKMQLHVSEIALVELAETVSKTFKPLVIEKGLTLEVNNGLDVSTMITSDRQRIQQILKNFMSNALKFTTEGGVTIDIYQPDRDVVFSRADLEHENVIGFDVRDTGIGIPEEKQKIIFEAFQQLEGGTARKYGGTGLGLSISRELASLLGGEIQLRSEENVGSVFTLFLPKKRGEVSEKPQVADQARRSLAGPKRAVKRPHQPGNGDKQLPSTVLADDRDVLTFEDKTVLIIEDDINFAKTLQGFCREKGFKCLVSLTGEEGLQCAEDYPVSAIILDINLPGIDGWTVLESLKDNPSTRHIPVHFMSADDPVPAAYNKGAIGYLTKPVSPDDLERVVTSFESMIRKNIKDLLLVEDNDVQRQAITKLIRDDAIAIRQAGTGRDGLKALREKRFDCMILDLGLPDMSGFELLKSATTDSEIILPPVVIYTGRELTKEEEGELRHYSESIIIKGVRSEERLLDETSLFLHQVVEKMPEEKRKIITALHDTDQLLRGRNILIVDDDMRNVFALSKVLNEKGINTIKAENGIRALEILDARSTEVDLVLMDIMMPLMDGYETMRKIREQSSLRSLPIIALTAKAMQRDKDDCIAAGASDYLAKPVDIGRLLSMMRVWLYR